ncbi:MAG TPA: alpha/beta hydrolase [Acidimicrobiales bacterium]
MAISEQQGALEVPARVIPVPTSISPEAQAILAMGPMKGAPPPPLDDLDGWRASGQSGDAYLVESLGHLSAGTTAEVTELDVDGVRVFDIRPEGVANDDPHVVLEIHGGALVIGAGEACKVMALGAVDGIGRRMWAVDYRMPPDHPYPAALDDCLTVYRKLLEDRGPEHVVVRGGSAGGNLGAALVLRARDEGLPLPAGAVLMTPEVDLTESGDSFQTNLGVDTVLTASLMPQNLLYAGGHDLTDPYLSPLFGDFTKGFCPTLLTAGTRDLFLSNAVRLHRALRRAGVRAELHVTEAAPHGLFFGAAPEDREITAESRRFIDELFAD